MVNQDPQSRRTIEEIATTVRKDLAELRERGVFPDGYLVDLAGGVIRVVPPIPPLRDGWKPSSARTFVVPESGTYHFGTGMTPHLIEECISTCPLNFRVGVRFDSKALSVDVTDSDVSIQANEMIVTTVTWEEYPRDRGTFS